MNILYSGDANIADGVIISALSIAEAVSEPVDIYILTASVDYDGKHRDALPMSFGERLLPHLRERNPSVSLRIIDISEKFETELPSANMGTRFTPLCMLRLFADEVAGLPDKILYLDNDVICRADIAPFYHQNIEGISMAGVLDYYGSLFFRQRIWRRDYLNSGVLLLNLDMIRRTGLFREARKMCTTKKMFMPDQSALNKLCRDKRICDRRYNEQRRLSSDTVLQHFTTSFRLFPYFHSVTVKPWNIEEVHRTLKLHEYDGLLGEYLEIKNQIEAQEKI